MKILMLGWELPPHFAGGMGTVCYHLCDYLARNGADITFILPFEADYSSIDFMRVNPQTPTRQASTVSYKDLYKVNATAYGKADISYEQAVSNGHMPLKEIQDLYLDKVARISAQGEFDVIHVHDWMTMRAGILAKQITGLPLIVHIHATEFDRSGADEESYGNPRIHEIEYQGMLLADVVIAVSQLTKDIIVRRYGIEPDKIKVVHNSVDLDSSYYNVMGQIVDRDEYKYLRRLKDHGYKIILNVGRHTLQKGLSHLLNAAALAIEKNPKLIFLMVGSGDQHQELIKKAAELGIAHNVIFTGFHGGVRVREAFKLSDVFLMPSVSEPFGITPLEAMGYGTATIISKQSGVSEMIRNTFKVDFWDEHAIADRVIALCGDVALREYLVRQAYIESEDFTYHKPAKETHAVYEHAIGVAA